MTKQGEPCLAKSNNRWLSQRFIKIENLGSSFLVWLISIIAQPVQIHNALTCQISSKNCKVGAVCHGLFDR